MRMRKIVENRTLKNAVNEFLAFKRAQKVRERTLHDYRKYINPFIEQSSKFDIWQVLFAYPRRYRKCTLITRSVKG